MPYQPTTFYHLLEKLQGSPAQKAAADKQLARFGIADSFADPGLMGKLALADPALMDFLGDKLANAVYNLP